MSSPQLKPAATYAGVLGAVLVSHRNAKGMTQAQLAEAAGLSQSAWSRIENGSSALTIDQVVVVAAALRTAPGKLVTEADEAVATIRRQGVRVVQTRGDRALEGAVVMIGLAALLVLVLAALSNRE